MRFNSHDKENLSTARINFNLTEEEKRVIVEYCDKHHISISEFCRVSIQKEMERGEN